MSGSGFSENNFNVEQLFLAVKNNDYNRVIDLARPANINARDKYNMTPLHWAARNGHSNVVDFLLSQGLTSMPGM